MMSGKLPARRHAVLVRLSDTERTGLDFLRERDRELATLIRLLRLGYERDKVAKLPVIHKLTEAPPRAGFFERADFEAVRRTLRPDLQLAVTIAHSYGWRMQSEVLTLGLSQIDLPAGTMRINPGGSKPVKAVLSICPQT